MNEYQDSLETPRGADEKVRRYLQDIKRGISARREHLEVWQENEKACFSDDIAVYDDQTRIDKLGSFIESRTAALAHRNPRCKIMPRNESGWEPIQVPVIDPHTGPVMDEIVDPMTGMPMQIPRMRQVPRFKVLESAVNYLLSKHDFRAAASGRLCVRSALLTGIGCLKVGYTADYDDSQDDVAPAIPLQEAMFQDMKWLQENYEFADSGEPMVDSKGMLVPRGLAPISEQWFIEWVDTKRIIFDPDGENDFDGHAWMAYEYWRPISEVKADKRLKNTEHLQATGRDKNADPEHAQYGLDTLEDRRDLLVRLFEVWDFREERLLVLAEHHDKPLRDVPIPKGVCPKTGPFAFYRPVERPSEWYAHAPATNLRKIAASYNDANRQAMQEMRKATTKILVDSRYFEEGTAIQQLQSPIKEVIRVDMARAPAGLSLEQSMLPVKYPSVAPEMFQFARYIADNFDEVAGQPGESRGVATANTATQTNALMSREFLREEYQRGIYAECWRAALKKLVDSLQTNMTIEQAITIMDGDGLAWLAMLSPDMIQGDYDIDIDVQDMEPMDKQQDRANLVNLLTIIGQSPFLALDEQAFEGLCEMFSIHDKRISKGISRSAEMQMMILASAKQPGKPGSEAPQNEGDAIAQQGGGVMYGG